MTELKNRKKGFCDDIPVPMFRTRISDAKIVSYNQAFVRFFEFEGREKKSRSGIDFSDLCSLKNADDLFQKLIKEGSLLNHEIAGSKKSGKEFKALFSGRIVRDEECFECSFVDVAHYHHPNLPQNMILLKSSLQKSVSLARKSRTRLALVSLDIDRFKKINETLIIHAEDKLLSDVEIRLKKHLRDKDIIINTVADEFYMVINGVADTTEVSAVVEKMITEFREPFHSSCGMEIFLTVSAGVTIYPADGENIESLLKNADTALHHSKDMGGDNYHFFNKEMNFRAFKKLEMELSLRHALERKEFYLVYQPQINSRTNEMIGVEALIRWNHPELGLIYPMKFIPLTEETGLIVPIGEWVLRAACEQNKKWQDKGFPPMVVSVNLSPIQFAQKNIIAKITDILKETKLDPKYLELEITESVIMKNAEDAIIKINKIKEMGIRVSIDDFGTGYSSLSYLKRFNIDTLKIDRSFVRDVPGNKDDSAIVSAIINLSRSLNLQTVAEGVETAAQNRFLLDNDCEKVQGFFFSKPVDSDKIESMFNRKHK